MGDGWCCIGFLLCSLYWIERYGFFFFFGVFSVMVFSSLSYNLLIALWFSSWWVDISGGGWLFSLSSCLRGLSSEAGIIRVFFPSLILSQLKRGLLASRFLPWHMIIFLLIFLHMGAQCSNSRNAQFRSPFTTESLSTKSSDVGFRKLIVSFGGRQYLEVMETGAGIEFRATQLWTVVRVIRRLCVVRAHIMGYGGMVDTGRGNAGMGGLGSLRRNWSLHTN